MSSSLPSSAHYLAFQGSSVADAYLQSPVWSVRGVTRSPSSAKASDWAAKGVEIVQGDLDDVASLKEAFKGASVVFGVTDFWTIFQDPESQKKKRPDQELVEYCHDVELQQGKNLADAAASVPGLHRYVFSSMANATTSSGGKYTKLYHMDSKAKAVDYALSLHALAAKFSQVQAPIYFQLPWQWGLPTTPKQVSELCFQIEVMVDTDVHQQPDGTWSMLGIGAGNKGIPMGDVRKDFGRCVKAVAEAEANINLFAIGEYVSWTDYLRTFCETQGLKYGGYDEATYDEFCELLPGGLGHEFSHNVLFAFDFGYEGNDPSVVRPEKVWQSAKSQSNPAEG